MPKYSIVTVALNGIEHTVKCVESILRFTKDYELIVVDCMTDDGTSGYLSSKAGVKVIRVDSPYSFAENNNIGLTLVSPESEYVVFLNNDTIVTPNWLERIVPHFTMTPLKRVGAVGPVCNKSNGRQMVGPQDSEKWNAQHKGSWKHTGVLYGWCMVIRKDVLDEVEGFDERFLNSWEDNDLSLRIQLAGYQLLIAYDTYIHHTGQASLRQKWTVDEYMQNGSDMREVFFDKYRKTSPQKLVAVYRTNGGKWLEASLARTSEFADSILIHFCRAGSSFQGISRQAYCERLKELFPKIKKIGFYDGIFQEDYERNWLLQEALKLQKQGEADWCISVDDDELYETKIIDRIQAMMCPRDPQVLGYWANWRTIWDTRCGVEYYRQDSTFGAFMNYRLFRLIPGQEIYSFHPEGHHCGSAPWMADENLRWTNIRVKHMGYDTPEQRQKKFEFYEKNDNFKSRRDIGYDDYSHLISKNPILEVYKEKHGISCNMMLKNEERWILGCLENVLPMVDEFVLVDTGSTDKTFEIVRKFSETCPVPVKIINYAWEDNFSTPRNVAKYHSSQPWILFMDADERFAPEKIRDIWALTEMDIDVVMLNVLNYLDQPKEGQEAKVAPTQAARIFRNIPELFFNGLIHETIDDATVFLRRHRKIRAEVAPSELHHYGYLKNKGSLKDKLAYYESLNLKQIEVTEGKDPRPYFNLALHYMNDGEDKKALEAFQKSLEIDPGFWHSSQQMGVLNLQNAKAFLLKAWEGMPESHPARKQLAEMLNFLLKTSQGFVKVA